MLLFKISFKTNVNQLKGGHGVSEIEINGNEIT